MALARQAPLPFAAPVTQIGALFLAARNPARRLINATVNAFAECTADLLSSRKADADHDAFLLSVERLAVRGVQVSATHGCPCRVRYQSILLDVRAAQEADLREDSLIERVLVMTRRWSMALEKALKLRKSRAARAAEGQQR